MMRALVVVAIRMEAWAVVTPVTRVGVGPRRSGEALRRLLQRDRPDAEIKLGICGALVPGVRVGDVLVVDGWVGGPRADETVRQALIRGLDDGGVTWRRGEALTVKYALERPWAKHLAERQTGASICEMEGKALAEACADAGVPFAALRTVSDDHLTVLRRSPRMVPELVQSLLSLRRSAAAIRGQFSLDR